MSRRSKGPRLWLRPARRNAAGALTHEPAWYILDGTRQISTGLGLGATAEAKDSALSAYLVEKYAAASMIGVRDPSQILIDDVLALYARDKAPGLADPGAARKRLERLSAYLMVLSRESRRMRDAAERVDLVVQAMALRHGVRDPGVGGPDDRNP